MEYTGTVDKKVKPEGMSELNWAIQLEVMFQSWRHDEWGLPVQDNAFNRREWFYGRKG